MADKDWDYIARLEKAIKKKYGNEAVANPKNPLPIIAIFIIIFISLF